MWADFWASYGKVILGAYSVFSTILVLVVSFLIFMEKRNPYKTLAWLAVLNIFPILGLIIYLVFGQNIRKRKLIKTKYIKEMKHLRGIVTRQIGYIKANLNPDIEDLKSKNKLVNLLLRNANAPFTKNNHAQIFSDGHDAFTKIFIEMEKAVDHIHLEYYIIRDDNIGQKLKEILIRKAQAGVKVKVIYDAVGCWHTPKKYMRELRRNGVKVFPFLPVALPFINNKLNYRNHRKIIVVDGKVGFLGGLNIGDEYLGYHPKLGKWRDTHLQLSGTSVHYLQIIFLLDWEFVSGETLSDESYLPKTEYFDGKLIQIAASGPDSDWENIQQSYFALINSAQKSIKITTPYLIPDEGILLALKTAALSGLDVKIIVPGKPDRKIVACASQSYFEELLEAGVEIFLYKPGFIHAKVISVDGEVASLGSANLDLRSFQLNFEVNAMIYDRELVNDLDRAFEADLQQSIRLSAQEFAMRSVTTRVFQSAARLLSPLL